MPRNTELKPTDKLEKVNQFDYWASRTEAQISNKLGAEQLQADGPFDGQKQEEIFGHFIQTVKDEGCYAQLQLLQKYGITSVAASRRGYLAWKALAKYCQGDGNARIASVEDKATRKQKPDESAARYTTEIMTACFELRQLGEDVSDNRIKRHIFGGLLPVYGSFVSQLKMRQSQYTLPQFITELEGLCKDCEDGAKAAVQTDQATNNVAFFGSAVDPFGYQQPPQSLTQAGPTTTQVTQMLNSFRSSYPLPAEVTSAVERALAAVGELPNSERRACYLCGRVGHLARDCANGDQRQPVPWRGSPYGGRGMNRPPYQYGGGRGRGFRPWHQRPQAQNPHGMSAPSSGMNNVPPPPDMSGRNPVRPAAPNQEQQHQTAHFSADYYGMEEALYYNGEQDFDREYEYAGMAITADDEVTSSPLHFKSNSGSSPSSDYVKEGALYCDGEQDFGCGHEYADMALAADDEVASSPLHFKPSSRTVKQENFHSVPSSANLPRQAVGLSELVSCETHPAVEWDQNGRPYVSHLLEICAGGTLAFLSAFLKAGVAVHRYSYIDNNAGAYYIAKHRIEQLRHLHGDLLPATATLGWDNLPQDITSLTVDHLKNKPPVSIVAATPPCQPFSVAGSRLGWSDSSAIAFISCVNFVRSLYDAQQGQLAWMFENVPGSVIFTAVRQSLGRSIIVDATILGSSARRDTALWTNAANLPFLKKFYSNTHIPGLPISMLLTQYGFAPYWEQFDVSKIHFPKFVSRVGSWNFRLDSNGEPGSGMLQRGEPGQRELVEPCVEIREVAMGMPYGATDAVGIDNTVRHRIIGACMDHNIARWFVGACISHAQQPPEEQQQDRAAQSALVAEPKAVYPHKWIDDSGCTKHMTGYRCDFLSYEPIDPPRLIFGLMKEAIGKGTVRFYIDTTDGEKLAELKDVWHVPGLLESGGSVHRLFSQRAAQAATDEATAPLIVFGATASYLDYGDFKIYLDHDHFPNLYTLHVRIDKDLSIAPEVAFPALSPDDESEDASAYVVPLSRALWHRRTGHPSGDRLNKLLTHNTGAAFSGKKVEFCNSCATTKSTRQPSGSGSVYRPETPFIKVGCDILTMAVTSTMGYNYILGFVCYCTGYSVIYLMRKKDEAPEHLGRYLRWITNQGYSLQEIRCDSDAVFKGKDFQEVVWQFDATLTYSAPYTPTQNCIAERYWGTLLPMVRAMLKTALLPAPWWDFVSLTANFQSNRMHQGGHVSDVPQALIIHVKPDVSRWRTFGCPAYVHIPANQRRKLEDTAFKGIFVGYSVDTYGYIVYNPATNKLVTTRHVRFDETFDGRLSEEGTSKDTKTSADAAKTSADIVSHPVDNNSDSSDDDDPLQLNRLAPSLSAPQAPQAPQDLPAAAPIPPAPQSPDAPVDDTVPAVPTPRKPTEPAVHPQEGTTEGTTPEDTNAGGAQEDTAEGGAPEPATNGPLGSNGPNARSSTEQNDNRADEPINEPTDDHQHQSSEQQNDNRVDEPINEPTGDQHQSSGETDEESSGTNSTTNPEVRMSNRQRKATERGRQYSEQLRKEEMRNEARHSYLAESTLANIVEEHIKKPSFHPYLQNLSAYLSMIDSTPTDPPNRKAAMSGPFAAQWKTAEGKEIKSLHDLETYVLVECPEDANIISCKWVYKLKYNADGSIERFKARLVARGFLQIKSIDYEETFAPTAKFVTIRLLCALACSLRWPLEQCDIETAFLWSSLPPGQTVYMKQIEGYEDPDKPNHVCKLLKSLYGLKQAPYLWSTLLAKTLKSYGYKQLITDSSCFTKSDKDGVCAIIACYVDDLLILGRTTAIIDTVKEELKAQFKVKSLGEVSWILGIAAERNLEDRTFILHQRKYINDMVVKFGQQNAAARNLPYSGGDDKPCDSPLCDSSEINTFRSLVGSLLYCAVATRVDIVETVNRLCRTMQAPTKSDLQRAIRCLQYLKGTADLGLCYSGEDCFKCYCDSNWAGALDKRRSRSGYSIMVNNAALIFRSLVQKSQALSTAEAEYVALCAAIQDACFLLQMLQEMGMPLGEPMIIFEDNQACIAMAIGENASAKLKHIDLRYHFARLMVEEKKVKLVYCPTYHQAADILTKPTDTLTFHRHRATLMGILNTIN